MKDTAQLFIFFSWGTGIRGMMRGMAWQPSSKLTRNLRGQRQSWKTPRWAWGDQVRGVSYFSIRCSDIVGWV